MRNPKKGPKAIPSDSRTTSPYPKTYYRGTPEDLERQETLIAQKDFTENTLRWGTQNDFPLTLAKYVQDSPAASACIATKSKFIKGSGFSDPDAMKIVINKNGMTLWDLHCMLCDSLALFDGYAVKFAFNMDKKITNAFNLPIENSRFVKPDDDLQTNIESLKYNPYFGTKDYQQKYTTEYALWDPNTLNKGIQKGRKFTGQVYYYGKTKPLYRFYPVPDYWSAKKWIYVDGKIQEFHAENLDNGFFSSVILQMIGDPAKKSKNPAYMRREIQPDGTTKLIDDKTVGEEFDDMMGKNFSGSKKAGAAMVFWANNKDSSAKVEPFPNTVNAEMFGALQDLTTKNITIATRVPAILANISEGASLNGKGNEMQNAIELMQSNTQEERNRLEAFYNDVLIPNLAIEGQKLKTGMEVGIVNYQPVTTEVKLDPQFWAVLNDKEKRQFMRDNFSEIELEDEKDPQTAANGEDLPEGETNLNPIFVTLTGRQQQQFLRILRQYGNGKLNLAAATIQLQSFGMTDDQITEVLGLDDPIEPTQPAVQQPLTVAK